MTITHWAEVVKTWQMRDRDDAAAPRGADVLDSARDLETRYRFRPDQAIYVIAVRAYRARAVRSTSS